MPVLAQFFLALMGGNLVSLTFLSAGHLATLLSFDPVQLCPMKKIWSRG
jgi:hypothetical protein